MIRCSVEEAEQSIDAVIQTAQHDPVEMVRDGVGVAVVLSVAALRNLVSRNATAPRKDVEAFMEASKVRHDSVYRELAAWEAKNEPPELGSKE